MSFYNNARFSQIMDPLLKNPFIETFDNLTLIPPPGTKFMVTEVTHENMETEGAGALMVTES